MSAKRRSISVKGSTYQRLKNYCERTGRTISGYLEEIVAEHMDDAREPIPTLIEKPSPKPKGKRDADDIIGQYFTF